MATQVCITNVILVKVPMSNIVTVLLFIHRNFFIMALRESPKDPLHSRFSFSFLATFSCAVNTLRYVRSEYEGSIQLLLRHWTLWAVALAAGVSTVFRLLHPTVNLCLYMY